jgi:hypothetical protein
MQQMVSSAQKLAMPASGEFPGTAVIRGKLSPELGSSQ